jgi:hypothetical protein
MPAIAPRSAQIVQPTSDFHFDEKTQTLIYEARTFRKGRWIISTLLMFPLIAISIFAAFFGLMASTMGSAARPGDTSTAILLFLISAASAGILFAANRWAAKPKISPIFVDAKSITVGNKTYLLEHVSSIGWRASGGYTAGGTGLQGAATMAGAAIGYATSGYVYIQYGADEIPIITSLHPDATDAVYRNIIGFLRRFGHNYGS